MLHGEKGCDGNSPGIGDIAYVKDLRAKKIVTTNFRCSKFGVAYHGRTKYGWVSIRSLIEKGRKLLRDLSKKDSFILFNITIERETSLSSKYSSFSLIPL
jgi:hypothetical protein